MVLLMKYVEFDTLRRLEDKALKLLKKHMCIAHGKPHAIVLPGGKTPVNIYHAIAENPFKIDGNLRLILSDERNVDVGSPDSNYGKMKDMINALGIEESRVIRPHPEFGFIESFNRFHSELFSFIEKGGRITLGLLGIGRDGHTASLFTEHDLDLGNILYATGVVRTFELHRVSVTPYLLRNAEMIIFFTAGHEKKGVVEKLLKSPQDVIAARAVAGCKQVQLWHSKKG